MAAEFDALLTRYLGEYLPGDLDVSGHTISSYCTTFKLLLKYCAEHEGIPTRRISMSVFSDDLICRFLHWLATERGNSNATINQRLFAIRAFFRYAQQEMPQYFLQFGKILCLKKRPAPKPAVGYVDEGSIKSLLKEPDVSTKTGRRDMVLLCVMYDTGARVSEISDLSVRDVRLDVPAKIRLFGKGRKIRDVPILPKTAELLKNYMHENRMLTFEKSDFPLFPNRVGQRLTRAGIAYILKKYANNNISTVDGLPVSPHVIRHTKAMHLLQAGVNIVYIRDLLGHVDLKTTEVYAKADLEMKRKALEEGSLTTTNAIPEWQRDPDMLTWLEDLARPKK